MRMRIAILSMIALACATEIAVAGPLPADFGQKLVIAAIAMAAIYLVYPVTAFASYLLWKRGKRALASGLAATLLLVGVVYPLADQRSYFAEHAHIAEATIIPESIDLKGKTVLVVASSCFDLCETMLVHSKLKGLLHKDFSHKFDKGFIKNGLVPKEGSLHQVTLGSNRLLRSEVPDTALIQIDYLIYQNLYSTIAPTLAARIPTDVADDQLGIRLLMAPVGDVRTATIDEIEPDFLVFYSDRKTYRVPMHPKMTIREPVASYGTIDAELGRLLCPEPNSRLRFVCTPRRKPSV